MPCEYDVVVFMYPKLEDAREDIRWYTVDERLFAEQLFPTELELCNPFF